MWYCFVRYEGDTREGIKPTKERVNENERKTLIVLFDAARELRKCNATQRREREFVETV
jgi:hypothetical protein